MTCVKTGGGSWRVRAGLASNSQNWFRWRPWGVWSPGRGVDGSGLDWLRTRKSGFGGGRGVVVPGSRCWRVRAGLASNSQIWFRWRPWGGWPRGAALAGSGWIGFELANLVSVVAVGMVVPGLWCWRARAGLASNSQIWFRWPTWGGGPRGAELAGSGRIGFEPQIWFRRRRGVGRIGGLAVRHLAAALLFPDAVAASSARLRSSAVDGCRPAAPNCWIPGWRILSARVVGRGSVAVVERIGAVPLSFYSIEAVEFFGFSGLCLIGWM